MRECCFKNQKMDWGIRGSFNICGMFLFSNKVAREGNDPNMQSR